MQHYPPLDVLTGEDRDFYATHHGGSGAVIIAFAIGRDGQDERWGVFSSIETAKDWRRELGEDYTCLFSPHIVDEPEWHNKEPS